MFLSSGCGAPSAHLQITSGAPQSSSPLKWFKDPAQNLNNFKWESNFYCCNIKTLSLFSYENCYVSTLFVMQQADLVKLHFYVFRWKLWFAHKWKLHQFYRWNIWYLSPSMWVFLVSSVQTLTFCCFHESKYPII